VGLGAEGLGSFGEHLRRGAHGRGLFVYASVVRLAPQETRTYFVTATTADRRSLFQVTAKAELLQQTLLDYRSQGRFLLHAFVIMPEHFHALITPAADVSLEKAMQFIKGGFSFRLKANRM
jgi:putative transposase